MEMTFRWFGPDDPYDRALGAAYLQGLWEALSRPDRQEGTGSARG